MSFSSPESDLSSDILAVMAGFDRDRANAIDAVLADVGGAPEDALYASDFDVDPTGVSDSTEGLQTAVTSAIAQGRALVINAGEYLLSRCIDINGATGLRVHATGQVIIRFPSDDTTVDGDAIAECATKANPDQAARSAFLLRGDSTGVIVDGITFQGGDAPQIFDLNLGCAIYADATTRNLKLINCTIYDGYSLIQHEQDGFEDGNLTVVSCDSHNTRGAITPCKGTTWIGCNFYRPMTADKIGRVTSFFKNGTNVTIACPRGNFTSDDIGRYLYISDSTTNDGGPYPITAVTEKTGTSPATLTYTRAAGAHASELGASLTRFFIPGGERAVLGSGVGALTKAGSTMTFVASTAAFTSADVGTAIRFVKTTSVENIVTAPIATVVSPTTVTFTNAAGIAEAFSGVATLDSFDNVRDAGINYGSTHFNYHFAGRGNATYLGCRFEGSRGAGIKLSGSTSPIEGMVIQGCTFEDCASAILFGADDSQEHTSLKFEGNRIINCGNGRPGWTESNAFYGFGARTVSIQHNTIHNTRDDVATVDGRGTATNAGIYIGRYRAGLSQPVENVLVDRNQITADPFNCAPTRVAATAVRVDSCGLFPRYRTGGTLTFDATGLTFDASGALGANVMELYDPSAFFSQELAEGWTISFVDGATAANNITDAVIRKVGGTGRIYFTNATPGAASSASVGTYWIRPPDGRSASMCRIAGNQFGYFGGTAITSVGNVAPDIVGNTTHGIGYLVDDDGSRSPRITDNRMIGRTVTGAGIRISSATSWPIIDRNYAAGSGRELDAIPTIIGDIGISVDGGGRADYPLLGTRVKAKPSEGRPEMVIAYGHGHVDGVGFSINGVALRYKAVITDAATQFNSFATLVARIEAIAGVTASDYGSFFNINCVTGHIRVRLEAPTTLTQNLYLDTFRTVNPTALVVLRGDIGGSPGESFLYGRGWESSAGVGDATIAWSPCAEYAGFPVVVANNTPARTLLTAGGYMCDNTDTSVYASGAKNPANAGVCEVVIHNDAVGTEEFRIRFC